MCNYYLAIIEVKKLSLKREICLLKDKWLVELGKPSYLSLLIHEVPTIPFYFLVLSITENSCISDSHTQKKNVLISQSNQHLHKVWH